MSSIPRILHFIWDTDQLPRSLQPFFRRWQELHPDWEIILWTAQSMRAFVADHFPSLLSTYDGYPKKIQRIDAFRYMVLSRVGGIYADLDVEPFKRVDSLVEFDHFVAVEPYEHIGTDRTHQGIPVLLSNAFMGSVPNHPMWLEICRLLPELSGQETFYSTGPSMLTAVTLRQPYKQRPVLLLPKVWSPLRSNGLKTKSDRYLERLLQGLSRVQTSDGAPLVSHKWQGRWVPWHKRNSRLSVLFQWPTALKWWMRRRRHPELVAMRIPDPATPYWDQSLEPVAVLPRVHVAIRLGEQGLSPELAKALRGLTYPPDRLSFTILASQDAAAVEGLKWAQVIQSAARGAAALNEGLLTGGEADHVLIVDGRVQSFPPDMIERLLAARRPVVAANCVTPEGANADPSLFRYRFGGKFEVLYKEGAADGPVKRDPVHRTYLGEQTVFNVLPVDGVGESFVLVSRAAIDAGVRFAETPYKAHLGGEALGIMARDKGFEAAGLPGLRVICGNEPSLLR